MPDCGVVSLRALLLLLAISVNLCEWNPSGLAELGPLAMERTTLGMLVSCHVLMSVPLHMENCCSLCFSSENNELLVFIIQVN